MKIEKFGRASLKRAIAAVLSLLAIGIAQPSTAQPVGRGPLRVTVTCEFTPFWVFNGFDNLVRFIPQMREVASMVLGEHLTERDNLARLRMTAGRGEQTR